MSAAARAELDYTRELDALRDLRAAVLRVALLEELYNPLKPEQSPLSPAGLQRHLVELVKLARKAELEPVPVAVDVRQKGLFDPTTGRLVRR